MCNPRPQAFDCGRAAVAFGTMVDAREQNVYLAKLAEQAERYDEMAEHMKVCGSLRALFRDLCLWRGLKFRGEGSLRCTFRFSERLKS